MGLFFDFVSIMEGISERLIDIEAVIASKNPRILKWIPGFLIRYLKRIVHQDEINGYIYRHRDLTGVPFVVAILKEFGVQVKVRHVSGGRVVAETLPDFLKEGRYIIASNHPLGGIDGMALMQEVGTLRPDIVFPVNDLLMNVPGLRPLFIPINKHGRNTENAHIIDQTFASDKLVLYFPAGLVSRKMAHGKIRDLEWKPTFIKKAKRYHRDVVPVYIDGRNSEWFYNLARWRKRLGIKINIEMLYLVDEMVKQFDKTITLTFGDPIPYTTFDKTKTEAAWAEEIRMRSEELQ